MKNRRIKILIGVFLIPIFLATGRLQAQSSPKYSNEFLAIGVGALALGMLNAMTSAVNDVTAVYWNPAALTDIEFKYQFAAQHAAYFAGVANYDYIGAAMAVDTDSHIGLSLIRLGIDDIPDTRCFLILMGESTMIILIFSQLLTLLSYSHMQEV